MSSRERYVRGHEEDGAPGGQQSGRGAKKDRVGEKREVEKSGWGL